MCEKRRLVVSVGVVAYMPSDGQPLAFNRTKEGLIRYINNSSAFPPLVWRSIATSFAIEFSYP